MKRLTKAFLVNGGASMRGKVSSVPIAAFPCGPCDPWYRRYFSTTENTDHTELKVAGDEHG